MSDADNLMPLVIICCSAHLERKLLSIEIDLFFVPNVVGESFIYIYKYIYKKYIYKNVNVKFL